MHDTTQCMIEAERADRRLLIGAGLRALVLIGLLIGLAVTGHWVLFGILATVIVVAAALLGLVITVIAHIVAPEA